MKRDFIINWQGSDFVKYEGLLDEAHRQGLKRISTTLVQIPTQDNGNLCIVTALVETEKGSFSGIGDASPTNVGRMIVPHIIRMAETRAKARALRDAVNVGVTSVEELSGYEAADEPRSDGPPAEHVPPAAKREVQSNVSSFPKASPHKPASANQLATIAKLSGLLGHPEEPSETMTSAEASDRITDLSAEYNAKQGANARRF